MNGWAVLGQCSVLNTFRNAYPDVASDEIDSAVRKYVKVSHALLQSNCFIALIQSTLQVAAELSLCHKRNCSLYVVNLVNLMDLQKD